MEEFGRRKTDTGFIVYASEKIGKLEEGYAIASKGFQDVLTKVAGIDKKLDELKDALYGNGPDHIGIFERIRALAYKVGIILFVIGAVGGFLGRLLEKKIFDEQTPTQTQKKP